MTIGHMISVQRISTLTVNSKPAAVAADKDRSPMGRCSIYIHPEKNVITWTYL